MDWVFVLAVVICLQHIPGSKFADAEKAVHQRNVASSPHFLSYPVSLGTHSTRKEKKSVGGHHVRHVSRFVHPSIREKLKNNDKLLEKRTVPESGYDHEFEKSKRTTNVSGVLEHLAEDTKFLRKKTTVNVTMTTISPTAATCNSTDLAEELDSELKMASELEKEEEIILKDLQSSTDEESSPQKQVESSPQKRVESSPQKRVESSPQKQVESLTRKRVESSPQKRVESSPHKRVESSPQKRVESSPQKRVESSTRKRVESLTRKRVESSPQKRVESSPQKRVESSPQKRVESSTRKRVESSPQKHVKSSPQKRALNPFFSRDYMASKILRLDRQKRELHPHKYNKRLHDFNNLLGDERSKRRIPKYYPDKYERSTFLLYDDDTDYDDELEDDRMNEQETWLDNSLKKRSNKGKKKKTKANTKKEVAGNDKDDNDDDGRQDDADDKNDDVEDDDDEEDDDDQDDEDDDDEDDDDEEDDNEEDDDEEDDEDDDEDDGKDDQDKNSLQKLSSQTQFLHKSKVQPKIGMGTIGTPLDRLKTLMKGLDASKVKENGEVKDDIDDEDEDDYEDPVKSSRIFKEYQEPYIPPGEATESSIIANAVLWIGVGVGTAFSAIMFMLCCSFYRCLTYYRTHLSSPLKSFLESYEDKSKSPAPKKSSSKQVDDSDQYIISISDKEKDGLAWSSEEEEEVFDISSAVRITKE